MDQGTEKSIGDPVAEVVGDYRAFVRAGLQKVAEKGIDVKDYPIDHLCFRVGTIEEYEKAKKALLALSKGFLENPHHGRPISKFQLVNPLQVDSYSIPIIELPSPKPERKSGLEHFEMVVGEDYDGLNEKYAGLWSGIEDSGEFNKPLFINFDDGTSVKFHKLSLDEVVRLEGNNFSPPVE